jgi:hypothetical protein
MSSSVIAALIGVAVGAAIGVSAQFLLQRSQTRRAAEAVLARYRDPLISAIVDLHWSIYNILRQGYLFRLVHQNEGGRREIAIGSTLYNFAEYFGWREVLRRESQLLEFEEIESTREVSNLLSGITSRFAERQPDGDESFRLFKAEQRAIGELMLTESRDKLVCVGYAEFLSDRRKAAGEWVAKLEADLVALSPCESPDHERLRDIQHRLAELAERLDHRKVRFPDGLPRA